MSRDAQWTFDRLNDQRLWPWQRTEHDRVAKAELKLDQATTAISDAEARLEATKASLAAAKKQNRPREIGEARLISLDRSLDRRIMSAVRRPASYLTDTLGPRPADFFSRQRWDRTATRIEDYRHKHLGLTPDAGALPGDGPRRAIGREPKHPVRRRSWRNLTEQIQVDLSQDHGRQRGLGRSR